MMRYPKPNEYVHVIDNDTLKVVGKGRLLSFTRVMITLEYEKDKRYVVTFDSRVHHFLGYEPKTMLVKKKLKSKGY